MSYLAKNLVVNLIKGEKMEERELVIKTMKEANEPLAAGKVAELAGLDKKVVDKVFKELKKEELIVSPIRCKWELKK